MMWARDLIVTRRRCLPTAGACAGDWHGVANSGSAILSRTGTQLAPPTRAEPLSIRDSVPGGTDRRMHPLPSGGCAAGSLAVDDRRSRAVQSVLYHARIHVVHVGCTA